VLDLFKNMKRHAAVFSIDSELVAPTFPPTNVFVPREAQQGSQKEESYQVDHNACSARKVVGHYLDIDQAAPDSPGQQH